MPKLVSVIIPCFNAERWLKEAINSCLEQSYSNIEIIVIDDGSTDSCLEIIKSYGDKIIWESGPNRGGNYARNRGFALSKGEYIQYLDADDYILPDKIERQVYFLEETLAEVVYGDWQHQRHYPDGKVILEDVKVSGKQEDILESLLANWWVSPACFLYRRMAVEKTSGWDESLTAGQDRQFNLSVVMSGAKVAYQPGCYSIYRRYGDVTVSTSCKLRYLTNHCKIIQNIEVQLLQQEKLSKKYKCALSHSYFEIARDYLKINYSKYLEFREKSLSLCPELRVNRTGIYNFVQKIFGLPAAEKLFLLIYQIKLQFRQTIF